MAKLKFDAGKTVVEKLGFKPEIELGNLSLAYLVGVELAETEVAEDSTWEFKGMTVPYIKFTFRQKSLFTKDDLPREHIISFNPISHEGKEGKHDDDTLAKIYKGRWDHLAHILNAFREHQKYKDVYTKHEANLSKTGQAFYNLIEKGTLETRVKTTKALYEELVAIFSNFVEEGETPNYLLGLKLIATKRRSTKGKSFYMLDVPAYVNKGYICKARIKKENGKPVNAQLSIELAPGESAVIPEVKTTANTEGDHSTEIPTPDNGDNSLEDWV